MTASRTVDSAEELISNRASSSTISVAIPTRNRPDDLEVVVRGAFSQTILPLELIIIDQSPGKESEERVRGLFRKREELALDEKQLVYIRDSRISGLTAARNRALDLAKGDIVLFLDDDVVLEANFVEEILKAYQEFPHATGVSGIVINYSPPGKFLMYWSRTFMLGPFHDDRQPVYWRALRLRESDPIAVTRLGGGLMSFRLDTIRGFRFDENLTGACPGEDVEFCAQLGKSVLLLIAPSARLVHKQSPAARSASHWLYLHARTYWYLYRRNWNHGVQNRVCFLWLNIGYVLAAATSSGYRRSLKSFSELWKAICDSRMIVRA